ncbi:MAG: protein-tyrosine sulfotransferase [Kiritimatiellia bacterium]|jgi:protein-tyrosine sulfotransferase
MQGTDEGDGYEGIIVLGCPRSGTTLLRLLLDAHPRIACPPEPVVFARVGRLLREDPLAEGLSFGLRSGMAFSGVDREHTLGAVRELAFGLMRDLADRAGKPRWASKTAMDAFYVDEIEELAQHHARFICITRHGLDTVCSLRDLCESNNVYLPEVHRYVQRHPFLLEALAHLWVDVSRRVQRLASEHPETALSIHYEDLVARPLDVMQRVCTFLGEQYTEDLVSVALDGSHGAGFGDASALSRTTIDSARVGRHRELSPHTRGRLAPIVNAALVEQGYEPIDAGPERSQEAAQRLRELGVAVGALLKPKPS